MKMFKAGRGKGKTTLLIIISHFTGARIITATARQAKYVVEKANQMNFKIPEPYSVNHFLNNFGWMIKGEKILIDDLDLVLQSIFKVPILMTSMTKDEEVNNNAI